MTEPSTEDAPRGPARRLRVAVGVRAAAVLALAALGAAVVVAMVTPAGTTHPLAASAAPPVTAAPPRAAAVLVHVTGSVAHPGLYELAAGARVLDAVAAAGGFTAAAERDGVNLARKVGDGEQLHVPAKGEAPPQASGVAPGGRIDLNTATEAQLETLPRVGPAMAARIVKWREANGPFRSVDELLEVTGIGEKTLEGLRDSVTV